jgi:hypothetical protein
MLSIIFQLTFLILFVLGGSFATGLFFGWTMATNKYLEIDNYRNQLLDGYAEEEFSEPD